jgi:hypothetical protein
MWVGSITGVQGLISHLLPRQSASRLHPHHVSLHLDTLSLLANLICCCCCCWWWWWWWWCFCVPPPSLQAINSFRLGLQLDPDAPMMHWGLAHAQGGYARGGGSVSSKHATPHTQLTLSHTLSWAQHELGTLMLGPQQHDAMHTHV